MEENVLCKVLGNLRNIFIKTVLDLLAKFMSLHLPPPPPKKKVSWLIST
jgi:hypothetical protein